jgi:hypothetical protein
MKTNYNKHKSETRTNIQFTENMTNYEQQLKLKERHLEQKFSKYAFCLHRKLNEVEKSNEQIVCF